MKGEIIFILLLALVMILAIYESTNLRYTKLKGLLRTLKFQKANKRAYRRQLINIIKNLILFILYLFIFIIILAIMIFGIRLWII